MVEAQYRVRRTIGLKGETFTVSGVSHLGIVTTIAPGAARRYLDDTTIDGASRPIFAIYVADDDTTDVSDTIVYDGLTLGILKIVRRRLRGSLLYKLILAAE